MPSSAEELRVAEHHALAPSTMPIAPLPVGASKPITVAELDVALGRRLQRSRPPADARSPARRSRRAAGRSPRRSPRPARSSTTFGLPSVSVPVLSTTSVSTFSIRSSASAFLISTPACGAAADADHDRHRRGEAERARAGDDQHRHGGDEAVGEARLRPERRPGDEGEDRDGDHRRHEPARHLVGEPLDRRAAALRLSRPSARSAPAACRGRPSRRASRSCPVWLSVPPITLSPGSLATGIDSPVTIDSSTVERPSITSPSTGTFSPGRTRSRSPTCDGVERDLLVAAVLAHAARGLRREVEQRADRAGGPLARAQLQHLAEQHQHGDDRGGLEIDRDRAVVTAEGRREQAGRERRDDAVEPGDAGAHRDQREHVEVARDAPTASRARRTASRPTARPASRRRAAASWTASGRSNGAGRRGARPSPARPPAP